MSGGVRIGSNAASLTSQRRIAETGDKLSRSLERLSSGQRINRPSDDAASLAIVSNLDVSARIYSRAVLNINDGLSLLSIGQASVAELKNISIRQRELAAQAANDTYSSVQRQALNRETEELTREYRRIIESTEFNGLAIFNTEGPLRLQMGKGVDGSLAIDPITFGSGSTTSTESHQDGSFASPQTFGVALQTGLIAVTDINGDGNNDLITGSNPAGSKAIVIYHGDGNGSFAAAMTIPVSLAGEGQIVDVDGNGRLDIFSAASNSINMLLQQGNGTFAAPVSFPVSAGTGVSVADLNGDSKLELIGPGIAGASYRIGDGAGGFGPLNHVGSVTNALSDVLAGDVDADGDNDLVILTNYLDDVGYITPAQLEIWRNNGSGVFGLSAGYDLGDIRAGALGLGDFNGDSKADLAYVKAEAVEIRFGAGNGTFNSSTVISMSGAYPGNLELADLNDDGRTDIVASTDASLGILLANGDGSFSVSISSFSIASLKLADVTGDGFIDIISPLGNSVRVYRGLASAVETTVEAGGGAAVDLDLTSKAGALSAMEELDDRLIELSKKTGFMGAMESRLLTGLAAIREARDTHIGASSRMKSVDVAEEGAASARLQILQNIGVAILSQVNQQPAIALQLMT